MRCTKTNRKQTEEEENEDDQPKINLGWKINDNSYGPYCPKDKKYFYIRPPTLTKGDAFNDYFPRNQKDFPKLAMLEI